MYQFKKTLAAIQKHHFWVLCALILVIGSAVWAMGSADLSNRFESRRTELDQDFQKSQYISEQEPNHPNERVIAAIHQQTEELKENVLEAWQLLYNEQQEKNPFPEVLDADFKIVFESLDPEDEIPGHYRERYQNFIRYHIPTLFERIDYLRPAEKEPGAEDVGAADIGEGMGPSGYARGRSRGQGQPDLSDMVGVVDWDQADRQRIEQQFDWQTRPSTLRVRLAQEDLWVYEALVRIIKNTNDAIGATTNYNAAVKRIDALQIGQDAVDASSLQSGYGAGMGIEGEMGGMAGEGAGAMGMAGEGGGGMGMGGMAAPAPGAVPGVPPRAPGAMPGDPMQPASPEQAEKTALLQYRYVDQNGQPLAAGSPHPYAEFKMMPIRMRVTMKQSAIPRLLVECADSNMPIEVRQVRFRPGEGTPIEIAQPTTPQGAMSGMGPAYGTPRMPYRPAPRPTDGGYGRRSRDTKASSNDIPVEIQGVICIYNAPDRDKLGKGAAGDQAAAGMTPDGSAGQPPLAAPMSPTTPPASPTPTPPAAAAAPPGLARPAPPPALGTRPTAPATGPTGQGPAGMPTGGTNP